MNRGFIASAATTVLSGLLYIVACGPLIEYQQSYIAPELITGSVIGLVEEFYQHCPTDNKVKFVALVSRLPSDASDTAVGRATLTGETGTGMVFIQLDAFLSYTDKQRIILVSHELLHSSFGAKHVVDDVVMHSSVPSKERAEEFKWEDVEKFCR